MNILILGSGAMGSLFAGKLAQQNMDVTVFNRKNDHVEKIHRDGLTIIDKDENRTTVHFPVLSNPADLSGDYDLILVLVKTFATEAVLETVLPHLPDDTPILTLQNGIGNLEKLQQLAPNRDIFVGGTYAGASVAEPGTILHQAWGSTFIGSVKSSNKSPLLEKLATVCSKSGLETRVTDNVQSIIWSKLLVNIAFNGLTAVTRLKNGDAIHTTEGRHIVKNLVEEASKIAHAKGIPLLFEDPVKECIQLGEEKIAKNTSSMLSDVLHERKTEIDAINGAIIEEGIKHDIPTPYNDMICHLVKVIENSYQKMVHQ